VKSVFRYLFLGPGASGKMVHNCSKLSPVPQDHLGNDDRPAYNVRLKIKVLFLE